MMKPATLRALLLAAAAGLLLGACAGPTPATAPAATETRDRVTASDEPEAQKRARARMELASAYFSRGQMTTALDQVKLAIAAACGQLAGEVQDRTRVVERRARAVPVHVAPPVSRRRMDDVAVPGRRPS